MCKCCLPPNDELGSRNSPSEAVDGGHMYGAFGTQFMQFMASRPRYGMVGSRHHSLRRPFTILFLLCPCCQCYTFLPIILCYSVNLMVNLKEYLGIKKKKECCKASLIRTFAQQFSCKFNMNYAVQYVCVWAGVCKLCKFRACYIDWPTEF